MVPGFVQADGEGPGWLTVVIEDVDSGPSVFVDVGEDFSFAYVGAEALWCAYDLPSPVTPSMLGH
jgi:hypothetical protein